MEVTPINRQSYMAEISNLLGLITDEDTRAKLIAQMEQMFDSAEDEGKLIEQIGSPTKVAVALIRYADKKRAGEPIKPAQAVSEIVAPEPVMELMEEAEANEAAPESGEMPELAFAEEAEEAIVPSPALEELFPEEDAATPQRLEEIVETPAFEEMEASAAEAAEPAVEAEAEPAVEAEAEPAVEAEAEPAVEAEETFVAVEEPVVEEIFAAEEFSADDFVEAVPAAPEAEAEAPAVEEFVSDPFVKAPAAIEVEDVTSQFEEAAPVVDEALVQAVAAEAAEAFGEFPAEEPLLEAEPVQTQEDPALELAEELFGDAQPIPPSASGKRSRAIDEEPEMELVKTGWKAFLYFLIPGLVPGLPVFLVLFALSLVFLAVGVAAVACAVGVFASAFIGFNVVADMLLLIGAGAAFFAVAMVLMWFAIWFLTQVCFGWVRLIHRGGIRFSCKEVPVE